MMGGIAQQKGINHKKVHHHFFVDYYKIENNKNILNRQKDAKFYDKSNGRIIIKI